MMANLELTIVVLIALLLVVAAVIDGATRVIPNWLNLAIALLAIPFWWATHLGVWPAVAIQIGVATAAFALFALFFALGQMGGGDVKLITALALFLPPLIFLRMLMIMAIAGGVLTLVMVVRHRLRRDGSTFENPYGIAIAFGALIVISERYLNHFA